MGYFVVLVGPVLCVSCRTHTGVCVPLPGARPVVTVIGEVDHEGNVLCLRGLTVSKAIKTVGGSSHGARSARILRSGEVIPVELERLGQDGYDPTLEPGDVLQVLKDDSWMRRARPPLNIRTPNGKTTGAKYRDPPTRHPPSCARIKRYRSIHDL